MERKELTESNTNSMNTSNGKSETSLSNKSGNNNRIDIDFQTNREGVDKIIGIINQKINAKKYPMLFGEKSFKKIEKSNDSNSIIINSEADKNKEITDLKINLQYFEKIENFYRDPFLFHEELLKQNKGNMDDQIFEQKSVNLLKKKYDLVEYSEFPIINRIVSKKNSELSQLSYFEIYSNFEGEKPYCNFFLKDIDFIPINYPENKSLFVLIERNIEKDKVNYLANFYLYRNDYIITKMFQKDKNNKKDKNLPYTVSIGQKEMDDSYLSLMKEMDRINNDILNGIKKQEEKQKMLKSKQELEKKMKCILEEGNKKYLEINFEIKTQEFDGFLKANKNIWISSGNNSIPIPKNSFIIVECKNNCKIDAIIKNISLKKRKLELLGIKNEKLYFIGILYDIKEDDETKFNKKNCELAKNKIFLIKSKDLVCGDEKFYENVDQTNILIGLIKDLSNNMEMVKEKINNLEMIKEKINNMEKDFLVVKKHYSSIFSD